MDLQYRIHVLSFLCTLTKSCTEQRCIVPISRQLDKILISDHRHTSGCLLFLLPKRDVKVQLVITPPILKIVSLAQAFLSSPFHAVQSFFAKIQYDTCQTYICCLATPVLHPPPERLFHQICSCRRPRPMNQHPLLPDRTLPLHHADNLICEPLSELAPSATSRLFLVGCV